MSALPDHRSTASERLRGAGLVEHPADPIIELARDATLRAINHAAEVLLGRDASELIGQPAESVVEPAQRARARANIDRVLVDGESISRVSRWMVPGGGTVPVTVSLSPVFDATGRIDGLVAIGRDISEESRMRLALRRSEESYRHIIETASEGVWAADADGLTTLVTDRLTELLGVTREDMLGRPFTDFIAEDDHDLAWTAYSALIGDARVSDEWRLRRADGTLVPVLASRRALHDADGRYAGGLALITDITDRVRAEEALRESERLARAVLDAALDGIMTTTLDGTVVHANAACEALFGRPVAEIVGHSAADLLVAPDFREVYRAGLARIACGDPEMTGRRFQLVALRPDGETFPVELTASLVEGRTPRITGHVRDLTLRVHAAAERARRTAEQEHLGDLTRRALEGGDLATLFAEAVRGVRATLGVDHADVWELLPGRAVQRACDGFDPSCSLEEREAGALLAEPPEDRALVIEQLDGAGADRPPAAWTAAGAGSAVLVPIQTVRGAPFGAIAAVRRDRGPVEGDDVRFVEAVAHVLATAIDRRRAEDEIQHTALHDQLTGLANRTLFVDRVRQALAATGPGSSASVLVLDCDRLTQVNDALGHPAGDAVLVELARRLRDLVRPGASVARIAGDEFAIVTSPRKGGERAALRLADRVLEVIGRPITVLGEEVQLTASLGIDVAGAAIAPRDAETLIRDAHVAMNRAKALGGGRTEVFDPTMRRRVVERRALEQDLRGALERAELDLAFEPLVSLADGRVVAVTTDVRWHHPSRGLLGSAAFLPAAEDAGIARALALWAVREACRQLLRWDADGLDVSYVAVDVPGRRLTEPGFAGDVQAILQEAGLAPERLALEVAEAALGAEGAAGSVDVLAALHALGVRLLLDDFGTGGSSLGHLNKLPVDGVKIARAFVGDLDEDAGERHIVEAIVGMSRALGLDVVAEGVAGADHARWLRRLGCAVASGPLFGAPAGAPVIASVLRDGLELGELAGAFGPIDEPAVLKPRPRPWLRGEETAMTLGEAAQVLAVSASTVRRWADSGRLRVVRTSGGHRRFARSDVERIAGHPAVRPRIRVATPAPGPLPGAATVAQAAGGDLAALAGRAVYEEDAAGWFGSPAAERSLGRWALETAAALRDGDEDLAAAAARRLFDDAREAGSGLVEADAFLGRYLGLLVRALGERRVDDAEVLDTRRLFGRLRTRLLEHAEG